MSGSRSRYRTRAIGGDEVVVEDAATGRVVGRYGMTGLPEDGGIGRFAAALSDDAEARSRFEGPMLEIARFCVEAGSRDPDVLRLAWSVLGEHADRRGIEILFGCATLAGSDAAPYRDVFAVLRARRAASEPAERTPRAVRFARRLRWSDFDAALRGLPRMRRSA